MTSPVDARAAEIRATQTEALLSAAPEDAGRGGLSPLRAAATERFRKLGAPAPRDEYWRFLSPARFVAPAAPAAPTTAPALGESLFAAARPLRIVFVNGRFAAAASDPLDALEGVEIHALSAGAPGWAATALGALEAEGQRPVPRPLAALNGALATDGLAIRATGAAPRPIEILHLGNGAGAAYLRHVVEVAPGAEATLLETGAGAPRFSSVIEADIAKGARLRHLRVQTDPALEEGTNALFAALGEAASLKSFTLSSAEGDRVLRNESVVWMNGDDGSAHLAGGLVGGDNAQADSTVFLTHDALRGESRQVFKNVLDQAARGIFQGKILVKEGAQQTDGYQLSQSVLLSETAAFLAKPELEIYADDVKCSHGSTTGALDETALFYLRARGVAEPVARALLIEAFLEEAIVEIEDDVLEDAIRRESRRLIGVARAPLEAL